MKNLARAALCALALFLCVLAFANGGTATISVPNSNGTSSPFNPTAGSFASCPIVDGPNSVLIDVSGTWSQSGGFAVWFVATPTAGTNTTARKIQTSSLVNFQTGDTSGITSGASSAWSLDINGSGTLYVVAGSGTLTGTPLVIIRAGPGSRSSTTGLALESGNLASILTQATTAATKLTALLTSFGTSFSSQFPAALDGANFKIHEQGVAKGNGSSVFTSFSTEASNTVTSAAALTTYTSGALGASRLGVIITNTGSVDAWASTESGGHTWLVPSGSTIYVPVGNGVTLYGLSTGTSTTLYCKEYGY